MRTTVWSCLLLFFASDAFGQTPEPPLQDERLSIHTLVREDIFAGWRVGDTERLARGEKNIDLLLEQRPEAKADLLAWKGGTKLYRAILAHEADDPEEFEKYFKESVDLFAEARKTGPQNPGVAAVVGGSYVMFADRLPEKHRADAWAESYDNYQVLWSMQRTVVDQLPEHIGGELLGGLAQSAQRTGRSEELAQHLDKILEVLPGTPYAREAERWKSDPRLAATARISCMTCHAPGRLTARIAELKGK